MRRKNETEKIKNNIIRKRIYITKNQRKVFSIEEVEEMRQSGKDIILLYECKYGDDEELLEYTEFNYNGNPKIKEYYKYLFNGKIKVVKSFKDGSYDLIIQLMKDADLSDDYNVPIKTWKIRNLFCLRNEMYELFDPDVMDRLVTGKNIAVRLFNKEIYNYDGSIRGIFPESMEFDPEENCFFETVRREDLLCNVLGYISLEVEEDGVL